MSRTRKQGKPPGYDYWSRRCFACEGYGRAVKKKWHKKARARERKNIFDAVKDVEAGNYPGRFPGE